MVFVGGSVAVSSLLVGSPLFTVQAVRYALACVLLIGFARLAGQRLVRPRGAEWLWLSGIAVTGLVVFNIALVQGSQHAEPAVLGVAVASVPVLMAAVGPLLEGARPSVRALVAALVVTAGAGLVEGLGRSDGLGLLWAVVVFASEAAFTLLAVPVLGRLRPWGVSVHTTWIAAVAFLVIGVVREGPTAVSEFGRAEVGAIVYLAVAVTALAFVLWYTCVAHLGSSRAGLLTGVAPVSAALCGVMLGQPVPGVLVWVGIAVVAAGLAIGLPSRSAPAGGLEVGPVGPDPAAADPLVDQAAGCRAQ
ncbi:DMT(drug/metabolite transporter) superfamily permease [Cryptosporangium arvum DSM 44712]|jgi:drug/metabolite transporter (DMT)-like permease|uniref:DMT(Drug/metabolite transporter) superfamily permease n=2 Tax=Cryptosporangium TaxID=65502 RepID=A0A010YJR1_9ACTN|nr:DMT(drug/metabolite transporter) superfamily permease [Cryptosporangium arvum DSM 44712]